MLSLMLRRPVVCAFFAWQRENLCEFDFNGKRFHRSINMKNYHGNFRCVGFLSLCLGVAHIFLRADETMNLDLSHLICINGFSRLSFALSNVAPCALQNDADVCVRVSDFSSPKEEKWFERITRYY